jgi:predicted Zn-dependent protease with MMP-like domain
MSATITGRWSRASGRRPESARANPLDREAFDRLVADALQSIPRRFRDALANVVIVVEDEPSRALLRQMGIDPPNTLLGLYQGTPLPLRQWDYGNTLPDRILIFQGPHERHARSEDDLVVSIGETLIHEIGHYFGMSEEQIAAIEQRYWRADKRGRESL